jgi:sec-independent protein translocase protein TatC
MAKRTAPLREPEDRLAPMKKRDASEHDQQVDSDERPFLEHLLELRRRILNAVLTILVLFFPLYYFANDIYSWVAAPLLASLPSGSNMIATEVASPFVTPFKLSMYSALFMSMPVILHQAWAFISPGLYLREKRFAMPLLISSIVLYYLGMLFAYYLVFPVAFKFFASVTPIGVTMMTDINKYLDFAIGLFLAFGFAFEIPIATFLIVSTGLTTTEDLIAKRPYVIVGCFVVGAIFTPPDVISQVMLAVPMWMLFEVGVLFTRFAGRPPADASSAETSPVPRSPD